MRFFSSIVSLGICALTFCQAAAFGAITSSFNTDADGWSSVKLAYPNPGAPPTVLDTYTPNWSSPNGNPGGFIYFTDPDGNNPIHGDTQYWSAPAKFLGDKSAYFGGTLTYYLTDYIGNPASYNQEDIILVGGGLTLVYDTPVVPNAFNWTPYSVGLSAAGWKVGSLSGVAATTAEMQTALGSLTAFYIRAEYQLGEDTGNLDEVNLVPGLAEPPAVPEPASLVVWGLGMLGCALRVGRRKKLI